MFRRWPDGASSEPLSRRVRLIVLAAVIVTHAGGGWALTQIEPAKLVVGDVAAIDVRMVSAEQPAAAQPEAQPPTPPQPEPPQPEPPQPEVPLAEPPPPPEVSVTDLASVVDPPPPDLPPPAFPVAAKPPPPEKPKPPPPKPVQQRQPPAQPAPAAPTTAQPSSAPAAAATTAPRTVSASQLGFLVPPNPVYPARSRRAGEQGVATVRVLVDIAGRPAQVSLQSSSGHAALDESALSAVRAAQFRPYAEGGLAQPVWVLVPIRFVLQ